jgi:hypothetical protein
MRLIKESALGAESGFFYRRLGIPGQILDWGKILNRFQVGLAVFTSDP